MVSQTKIRLVIGIIALYGLVCVLLLALWRAPFPGLSAPATLWKIVLGFTILTTLRHLLYMVIAPWFTALTNQSRVPAPGADQPLVSVIIPAWNEEVGLIRTVESILASDYKNLEIVVVNDGSTDRSDARMKEFLQRHHASAGQARPPIIYHYQPNQGKGVALNTGLALSGGDIIVTIDADSVVDPSTLTHFVRSFTDPAVMAAVGQVKIGNHNTFLGIIQTLDFLLGFYFKRTDAFFNSVYIIGGAAAAYRRSVFTKLGGFDPNHITEDMEMTLRLQANGLHVRYAHQAVVYTEGAANLPGLLKQRLRWKRGQLECFWRYRRLFFSLKPNHRRFLAWVVLPAAAWGNMLLLLETFFIFIAAWYAIGAHDPTPFLVSLALIGFMTSIQIMHDTTLRRRPVFFVLAPVAWILLYVMTFVEVTSLIRAGWAIARRRKISWQRWQRQGVFSQTLEPSLTKE